LHRIVAPVSRASAALIVALSSVAAFARRGGFSTRARGAIAAVAAAEIRVDAARALSARTFGAAARARAALGAALSDSGAVGVRCDDSAAAAGRGGGGELGGAFSVCGCAGAGGVGVDCASATCAPATNIADAIILMDIMVSSPC
jgi:hypothetical protein